MDLRKKIKFKIYFPTSVLATGIFMLFAKNSSEIWGIFLVYIATLLNLALLTWAVMELLQPQNFLEDSQDKKIQGRKRTYKIVVAFVIKLAILLGGLSLGVHFMGPRVIIPLLNYVIQIFILVLCFNRKAEGA